MLVDLGSGNGYPGLVIGRARPGLRTLLVEASVSKAGFLEQVARTTGANAEILARHVQRAADLEIDEPVRVLTTRAMGNWERVVPRLVPVLARDAEVLIWAGADVEAIAARGAWRKLSAQGTIPLPGRDRARIWRFRTIRP